MATTSNRNKVVSAPAPAEAVGHDCTYISLWSEHTTGDYLGSVAIAATPNPAPLQEGERFQIEPRALELTQPEGPTETNAMAKRALRGRYAGGLWVQYHTGNPGPGGGENLVGGEPRDPDGAPNMERTHIPQGAWLDPE